MFRCSSHKEAPMLGMVCPTPSKLTLFWKELAENQKVEHLNKQRHIIYWEGP